MIVSWNWLKDYVPLTMSPEEAVHRLTMSGLNHESSELVGDDIAIDLEVTSNRGDCLGHIGIAREISVLWREALSVPNPTPLAAGPSVHTLASVVVEAPQLCPRYTARVVRGVAIGPSPKWLADRLTTIGIAVVNNVVDITNYVMMECGQPLHAFDLQKLAGGRIIVREARQDEPFVAIDHRSYNLQKGMCVIADRERPVALGGVMGGTATEVTDATTDLLIEAADFAPLSVRTTARTLRLHSPSSYRFERRVDPHGVDWASRRACQLIRENAGGILAEGMIDVTANPTVAHPPIVLRFSQLQRVLGIEVPAEEVQRIVTALGNQDVQMNAKQIVATPPTWRRDLLREIDLIEEVVRIHGYDKIPEDVGVPMASSHQGDSERVLKITRDTLVASGFFEAMTPSLVEKEQSEEFSPWSGEPCLSVSLAMLRGADHLRKSLVPSILRVMQLNESLGNKDPEFFETARVYLPRAGKFPDERFMVTLASTRPFRYLKGVLEALVDSLRHGQCLDVQTWDHAFFAAEQAVQLMLNGQTIGYMGVLDSQTQKHYALRQPVVVAEIDFGSLVPCAELVPQFKPVSLFPAVRYDLNFVVDEAVRWADVAKSVRKAAGDVLDQLEYCETYRDPQKDGQNKKRLLFSLQLRSIARTLTGDQADEVRRSVIETCQQHHGAALLV
ncbi:MAG: phenylalanine--tRNA ligase subunit beta [Planctomycetota bacterium]|nr:phenylalanine--tRNA ligase subunit beta [Planctomycetota bacterium]MDA1178699.1 phenylalanine--tRNA ligase subunit beta [Planctomycetota bacterium]